MTGKHWQMEMEPRAIYGRSRCCIEGCRHTSACFESEWMCNDHWKRLPRKQRLVIRRVWRFMRKIGYPYGEALANREWRLWCWAKRVVA